MYDVMVLGLGAMGTAAAWHLAQRGASVLGLEQFDIPHTLGSSHGESRMIRQSYYEHPDYVPLLQRAYELWRQLEGACGERLLFITGGLYMGKESGAVVAGARRSAQLHGLPHQLLDRKDLANRFSMFNPPADGLGFFEPNAGYLLAERIVSAQARLAMQHGAVLMGHTKVEHWHADATGVTVATNRGRFKAHELVLCAGPWAHEVLSDLKVELIVTRQTMAWFSPRDRIALEPAGFPVWAIDEAIGDGASNFYYGFPLDVGAPGMKVANHKMGRSVTTEQIRSKADLAATADDEWELRKALGQYLPSAGGPLLSLRTCLYTNSRDHHFIIDRHPGFPHVTLACGFSGHGFKFASVIGEILAELALTGKSQINIDFLGLHRKSLN